MRGIRRFFTLEARPEDVHLRRTVEALLKGHSPLQFTPHRYIEKQLRIGLGEYEGHKRYYDTPEEP